MKILLPTKLDWEDDIRSGFESTSRFGASLGPLFAAFIASMEPGESMLGLRREAVRS